MQQVPQELLRPACKKSEGGREQESESCDLLHRDILHRNQVPSRSEDTDAQHEVAPFVAEELQVLGHAHHGVDRGGITMAVEIVGTGTFSAQHTTRSKPSAAFWT
jgi:hypothetical protein